MLKHQIQKLWLQVYCSKMLDFGRPGVDASAYIAGNKFSQKD